MTVQFNTSNVVSGNLDASDKYAATTAKVMVTGDTIFTVGTGDILIWALASECYTANNATASTIQYSVFNPATAATQTISAASASLANAAVGVSALAQLGALTNAPVITTAAGVGSFPWGAIRVPAGCQIKTVIGVGSTVGTWKHYIKYTVLENGGSVTAAF